MTKQELEQQWKSRIVAYRASGLTQVAFCKAQNISLRQLSYWLRKEAMKGIPSDKTTQWLPVNLSNQGVASEDISLHIKIGPAVVEVKPGFDQKLLLDVERTLRALC